MNTSTECEFISNLKFFDLLLAQFKGVDGELPSSITYLTQAANEINHSRRDSLIRIARGKLINADIAASILLQVSTGRPGPVACKVNRMEFDRFQLGIFCNIPSFQLQR
jgi:Mn-containing catalase